jgi:crossover junction endodeoxyribonuclease RuvC
MGIDPGTFNMGVGVVESCDGRLRLAHSEVLTARRRHSLAKRLGHMHRELDRAIRDLAPAEVAIEEPFVARNVRAAMAVGQAQAVAMVAVDRHGLEMFNYSPRQVKKAVTDYGGSSKEQVQEMVKVLLDLQEPPQPSDAADALAVAICHINASQGRDALLLRP